MGTDPSPSVMASWPAPNTTNPQSQGNGLLAMQLVLVIIVVLVVSLRIYTALFLNRSFRIGDWMLIPATVFYIGLTIAASLGTTHYGWGKHAWDVPLSTRETALLVSFISELLVTWSLSLAKLSLCCFYNRQIPCVGKQHRWRRWTVYLLVGLTVAWGVESTMSIIFQCHPVKGMWKINYSGEHCNGQRPGLIAHVVIDIVTVMGICLWPFSMLLRAAMLSWKQMVLAMGLAAIGAFVCASSILRLPATLRSTSDYDITWFMCDTYRWSILECSLAIILATLPLLTTLLPNSFTATKSAASTLCTKPTTNKVFQDQGVHSYPLADIQTTATTNAANSNGWWGTTKSQDRGLNESEENIISKEEKEVTGGSGKGRLDRRIDIHKTTVIEQRFEADLEKGDEKHKSRT